MMWKQLNNGWQGWLNWTCETEHLVGRREVFWANWPKCIRGLTKKRNGRDKVNTALETQQTGTKEQGPGKDSILEDSTDSDAAWKHAEDKVSWRIWKLLLYYINKAIMETWESTAFTDNWSVVYKVFTKVSEGKKRSPHYGKTL